MIEIINHLIYIKNLMFIITFFLIIIYEIINGFHDAANAIVILIQTRTLKTNLAIFISGIFNFLGVTIGGVGVAYSIIYLLPINLLIGTKTLNNLIIIFSILITSIIWNFFTWYMGIPTSSSHTLIGSIIGINISNALIKKIKIIKIFYSYTLIKIFISLIISPIIGFIFSGIFIIIIKNLFKKIGKYNQIKLTPKKQKKKTGKKHPPFWIRFFLIISSAVLNFIHGANDGQKGLGIAILILINIAPENFTINLNSNYNNIHKTYKTICIIKNYYLKNSKKISFIINKNKINKNFFYIHNIINKSIKILKNINNYKKIKPKNILLLKNTIIKIKKTNKKIINSKKISLKDKFFLNNLEKKLTYILEYSPLWIIILIAGSLSLGTMIGWKKISKTIGEKISKKQINYLQGLSTQLTTIIAVNIANYTNTPISITHVISSAITSSIYISGGKIQKKTLKNIFITWIITIPITILTSSIIYYILYIIIFNYY